MDGLTNEQLMRLIGAFAKAADFNQQRDCEIYDKLTEEITRRKTTASASSHNLPA